MATKKANGSNQHTTVKTAPKCRHKYEQDGVIIDEYGIEWEVYVCQKCSHEYQAKTLLAGIATKKKPGEFDRQKPK